MRYPLIAVTITIALLNHVMIIPGRAAPLAPWPASAITESTIESSPSDSGLSAEYEPQAYTSTILSPNHPLTKRAQDPSQPSPISNGEIVKRGPTDPDPKKVLKDIQAKMARINAEGMNSGKAAAPIEIPPNEYGVPPTRSGFWLSSPFRLEEGEGCIGPGCTSSGHGHEIFDALRDIGRDGI